MIRIGVTGVCSPNKFDFIKVWELLDRAIKDYLSGKNQHGISIVGGLTDVKSVHQIGYYMARQKGWNCVGIAPEKAKLFKWFPMSNNGDNLIISGKNWGDELDVLLKNIDVLIRVGGGPQAHKECKLAKEQNIPVIEVELDK